MAVPSASSAIALSLAGGGFTGAIYEVGALRALEEAIAGLRFDDLSIYTGVSAGALLGACLANRIDTKTLCRLIALGSEDDYTFAPSTFQRPDVPALIRRSLRIPGLLGSSLWHYLSGTPDEEDAPPAWTDSLTEALPIGFYDNGPIRDLLKNLFAEPGRTDDFRQLTPHLYVVATELATGKAAVFGTPGLDHIPISDAVMASSALPGLYPPVELEGTYYVDGVLIKTMHASIALDQGASLVFAVNPIVPFDATHMVASGALSADALVKKGMPTVLSQTFRTLIHSRLQIGIAAYATKYPAADILLFEPPREEAHMFFANAFSFKNRKRMCEYGFRATLAHLRAQAEHIGPVLAQHGLDLRMDVVNDTTLDVWKSVHLDPKQNEKVLSKLSNTLDALDKLGDDISAGA